MKRVLILNLTRMGDLLMTTPLIKNLKTKHPGSQITVLSNKKFSEVCKYNPFIDHLYELDVHQFDNTGKNREISYLEVFRYLNEIVEKMRALNFDILINLTHSKLSAVLSSLLKIDDVRGFISSDSGHRRVNNLWLVYFCNLLFNRPYNLFNLVDIYLKSGDISKNSEKGLTFEVPEESNAWLEQFLTSHGISNEHIVISLQPASSRADRRWPPEYFIKLSDLLLKDPRVKIVILGVESEGDLGREIEKNLPGERVINAVGKTTIPQLAALLRRCNFLVTNDTGTMHIAAAVKCRIIGLFFTHALVHETGPFGEGHIVFQADIPCSPCSHQTKCTHMICKEFILPGDVYTVISTLIEGEKLHGLSEKGNFCKNTRLFRSSFTDDGMCSFAPLLKKPIRIPDILAHSYRDIWRYFLENKKEYKTRQSIDRMLVNTVPETVATLKKGFLIDNLDSLLPALEVTLKAFLKIRENSERGQELTSWIIEESQKQNPDIFRIKGYGEQVQQVDAAIGKVGMVNPETSPVIKMFSFGSENLEGDDYGFLARQTAELYSSLSDESYAMAEHLKGVLGQLSIT